MEPPTPHRQRPIRAAGEIVVVRDDDQGKPVLLPKVEEEVVQASALSLIHI